MKFLHLQAFGGRPPVVENRSATHTLVVESCDLKVLGTGGGDIFVTDCPAAIELRGRGQRLWARQLNPEGDSDTGLVQNHGGRLWALGVKHEGRGVRFLTDGGGQTEILGLFNYAPDIAQDDRRPAFEVIDAALSAAGVREISFGNTCPVKVREALGDDVRTEQGGGWIGWSLYRGGMKSLAFGTPSPAAPPPADARPPLPRLRVSDNHRFLVRLLATANEQERARKPNFSRPETTLDPVWSLPHKRGVAQLTKARCPWGALCLSAWLSAFSLPAGAHPENIRPAGDLPRLAQAGPIVRELVERCGFMFEPADQQTLRSSAQELVNAGWYRQTNNAPFEDLSISVCQLAMSRIERVLQQSLVERISTADTTATRRFERRWDSGQGVFLCRVQRHTAQSDDTPAFVETTIDFSAASGFVAQIQLPTARAVYVIIYGINASHAGPAKELEFIGPEGTISRVSLSVKVPAPGELECTLIEDTTGQPTSAVLGLYARDHGMVVPPEAIRLDFWQNGGAPLASRPYHTSRYWPGTAWERRVCFVNGRFRTNLPEGEYQLIVGKGPEFQPTRISCQIKAGEKRVCEMRLRRWVNMPARGWISGDGHVHFSRQTPTANVPLLQWIQAEDVHVANVLRMGDANQTHFEQYGFGKAGRAIDGAYSLVSGQEDPRTEDLGHVLALNLQAPVRNPSEYHLYDTILMQLMPRGALLDTPMFISPPARLSGCAGT